MRWNFFRQGIARKTKSPPFSEKRSERSVPKLTDWDFGIPPLQTTFLVKTALRTLMEPTRYILASYQKIMNVCHIAQCIGMHV